MSETKIGCLTIEKDEILTRIKIFRKIKGKRRKLIYETDFKEREIYDE